MEYATLMVHGMAPEDLRAACERHEWYRRAVATLVIAGRMNREMERVE